MLGRARQDHVEQRTGWKRGEEIGTQAGDALAQAVGACILVGREGGVGVDVGRDASSGPGTSRCEREDARPRSDIDDVPAAQVEAANEFGESLTAKKIAWVKYRRAYGEAKAGSVG